MVTLGIVVEEPVQIGDDDYEWEAVMELTGVSLMTTPTAIYHMSQILPWAEGEKRQWKNTGPYTWILNVERQNSPILDQNSLPRRIQFQVLEFSTKEAEEKWVPMTDKDMVDCFCDEPGCEAGLTIDTKHGDLITVGNMGHIQTIQLPPNIRVCKLVE